MENKCLLKKINQLRSKNGEQAQELQRLRQMIKAYEQDKSDKGSELTQLRIENQRFRELIVKLERGDSVNLSAPALVAVN